MLLINNETFILAIFLITFFLIIYIIGSFQIKLFFFSNISNVLNILKYSNMINIYLDKILYFNIIIRNKFFKNLLKKKGVTLILKILNNKINNFLFFSIFNFFLILKKNLLKILKNKKLLILNNKLRKCEIIL